MRHLNLHVLLAATAIAGLATPALAGTASASLGTSATIAASCTVTTSPVAFGTVDPLSGANTDSTGGISVTCTNGTAWTAAGGAGSGTGATFANRLMGSGSNTLAYSLYTNSGRSTVWGDGTSSTATIGNTGTGTAQNITIFGRVPSGQTSAPPGSYSDTVAVTVSY